MADIHEFTKGWSVARLADEFGMDRRTASKRLKEAGVPPLTKRAGHDVYRLADAAPGVRFLLAEVDVQANRFVVLVLGFGIGESGKLERWVVDSFTLRTSKREDGSGGFLPLDPPKYLEDWERLVEKVISRRYASSTNVRCALFGW
ncbi:terminase gpA endonuclease subunit [Stenotrophomonas geniculata]|uniref:helix-turn-helix transcriptional regulator n=1 Tax=Stenotrophomonas TaxID=40323 RepID=UPI003D351C91